MRRKRRASFGRFCKEFFKLLGSSEETDNFTFNVWRVHRHCRIKCDRSTEGHFFGSLFLEWTKLRDYSVPQLRTTLILLLQDSLVLSASIVFGFGQVSRIRGRRSRPRPALRRRRRRVRRPTKRSAIISSRAVLSSAWRARWRQQTSTASSPRLMCRRPASAPGRRT